MDDAYAETPDQNQPPVEDDFDPALLDDAPPTKWPTVIGVISIIYASLGLLCGVGGSLMQAMMDVFMGWFGMDVAISGTVKLMGVFNAAVALILGVILLTGGINLVKRRRKGVTAHKVWVVLRIIMLVIGICFSVMTIEQQVDFQESMAKEQIRMARERGVDTSNFPTFNREAKAFQTQIGIIVGSTLVAIYPLFIGFFLARRKITDEIAEWV